jgi:hypothetical protein
LAGTANQRVVAAIAVSRFRGCGAAHIDEIVTGIPIHSVITSSGLYAIVATAAADPGFTTVSAKKPIVARLIFVCAARVSISVTNAIVTATTINEIVAGTAV